MRIIAGRLGGRQFASPQGHRTRPMSDKVRGALFNTLGDISGLTLLDAFAGSGALSYEALSRGAAHAVAIDSDKSAQQTISENVKTLGLEDKLKLIKAKAGSWLNTTDEKFDLVLCDPPYADIQRNLLGRLAERVKLGGLIVMSLPPNIGFSRPANYQIVSQKTYGDATLWFYTRTS